MSLITSQQITNYYNLYKNIDVTFTKEVIRATGFLQQQVFLKCLGDAWPCVIYSTSMIGAKIVANVKSKLYEKIRSANNMVSLRFSFSQAEKADPLAFFITAKAVGFTPYNQGNPDLNFISLTYTQRPPDDLIGILGRLLEANINSKKRKEERIPITGDTLRKLGLQSKDSVIFIQNIPRKAIVRDLSFSGAKCSVPGVAKFLLDKPCILKLETDENETLNLAGKVIRFEAVEGRKDIAALAVLFDEKSLPMEYKLRVSEYLSSVKKGAGPDDGAQQ